MEKNEYIIKKSCRLAYLLRHNELSALELGGWRSVDSLIHEDLFTIEELRNIVGNDSKGRFEFNPDKTKVRALYGHSVPIELNLEYSEPPHVLYHGTSIEACKSILREGIKPRARNFVHLTSDIITAQQTGMRHGEPVVIQINAKKMVVEGYKFYNPTKKIWLVSEVPLRFVIPV